MYNMNDEQLRQLQKELDEKKYLQSQTARQNLAGRMPYCSECYFVKFDSEKKHVICNLDEKSKTANYVCAKNHLRRLFNEQPTRSRAKNSSRSKKES